MTANTKFKSDALEAIHASAQALQKISAIDKAALRTFDESCIAQKPEPSHAQIQQHEADATGYLAKARS